MPSAPADRSTVSNRFVAAAQNDFAARLKWSVTPRYKDANHPPVVALTGPSVISATRGSLVSLEGKVSDPDGDTVSVEWWQYKDAGTYPKDISLTSTTELKTTFRVPNDAEHGQTIHLILQATDGGTPSMTRYERVVITVQ